MSFKALALSAALCSFSLVLAAPAAAVTYDTFGIFHDISVPLDSNGDPLFFDGNATSYQLAGQSAYIQTRTSSSTSGGQLDGAVGLGTIDYTEVFPPTLLTDYLTYSYIGVADLHGTDINGDPVVLDRSIVIAFQPLVAEGLRIDQLFPVAYSEATLVSQFTTQNDSPGFLDMAFNQVGGEANTSGNLSVLYTDCHNTFVCDGPTQIQFGDTLDLIAFIGGVNGDEGVVIGRIDSGGTRALNVGPVPEPETWAMLLVGVGLVGWRLQGCAHKDNSNRLA
jgi:hypothetical protein